MSRFCNPMMALRDEQEIMETLLQNLRSTIRTLPKIPGFIAVAVMTLALAVGASTALFRMVNAVLLPPLPYNDDSRLVVILNQGRNPVAPAHIDGRSPRQVFAPRHHGRSRGGVAV